MAPLATLSLIIKLRLAYTWINKLILINKDIRYPSAATRIPWRWFSVWMSWRAVILGFRIGYSMIFVLDEFVYFHLDIDKLAL